ncbi:uncharacterized protein si:dkey-61p9.7 isoform X2 [Toxotes jaculatrix]|uniref:uncharacterized protein si:dkey-61p9.7 isoform X2 n=1 Tax=Toxotes jaculatrix TaxID=941984 RepID=UPI001B3AA654|nr:uncharacterized protein si:dkey-61p9.7 isoform X2 [Toxotes jaculatrix]
MSEDWERDHGHVQYVEEQSKCSKREIDARTMCLQCEQTKYYYKERTAYMKAEYEEKLEEAKSLKEDRGVNFSHFQCCEKNELQHKQSMAEMEGHYKNALADARSKLKRKEEEFQSFKDRVARDLSLSIKTGDTESMNNPVSKIKLKEMYTNLRLLQWPKMTDNLRSNEENIEFAKNLIQKMFEDSRKQMEKNKKLMEEMCRLNENSKKPAPQKVTEYTQLTIQNLQLALFYGGKEDVKTTFPEYKDENPQSVIVTFRHLAVECYWLGCLMALSNPPLEPDWEKCDAGPDPWDIFPQDIKCGSEMESVPMEQ